MCACACARMRAHIKTQLHPVTAVTLIGEGHFTWLRRVIGCRSNPVTGQLRAYCQSHPKSITLASEGWDLRKIG